MKENKLTIKINKPTSEVMQFYLNPQNTPLWIDSVVQEKTSEWPIKVGTVYRQQDKNGKWFEYSVVAFKEKGLFELISEDKNYHVRYTHTPIKGNSSKLEYYEWVDQGSIKEPFTLEILEKLKKIVEQ